MRGLAVVVALGALLSACGAPSHIHLGGTGCTPPAGGRCAADVAWPGPIELSADGRRLHGIVLCGGTLHATETSHRVTVGLHVGAMGAGTMSCARVDVGVRLAAPLASRTVVDAVSGAVLRVVD
ncbi:hypothetical protein ACVW00_000358 [Marmoricola sp. URHA0025 HA25]